MKGSNFVFDIIDRMCYTMKKLQKTHKEYKKLSLLLINITGNK